MQFLTALIVLVVGAAAQSPSVTSDLTWASSIIAGGGPGLIVTPTSSAAPVQTTSPSSNLMTIHSPLPGQIFNVGDIISINWTAADVIVTGWTVTLYWLDVRKGTNLGTVLPDRIATAPVYAMQYLAKVPATLPGAGNYEIMGIMDTDNLPEYVYSPGPFMVNMADSTTTSTTAIKTTTTTVAATVAASTTTTMSGASSVAGKAAAVCLAAPIALALLF